jgi:hypothetical protein
MEEIGFFITKSEESGGAIQTLTGVCVTLADALKQVRENASKSTDDLSGFDLQMRQAAETAASWIDGLHAAFGAASGVGLMKDFLLGDTEGIITEMERLFGATTVGLEKIIVTAEGAKDTVTSGMAEATNEIVTQQSAALESLKAMWSAYSTENTASQLKDTQQQTEKYNFMIDTQKKANTSLWNEAGKLRDTFGKGVSQMTMDWVKGDLDVKKSFEDIGDQMLKVLVDWAVQTGINWALSKVFHATEVATAAATGASVAAAWAPAAAMVSLATFGGNSVPAMTGISATNALAMAWAVPKAEEGGIIKGSPGGTLLIAGEKNKDEAIIPLDRASGIGLKGGNNEALGKGDIIYNTHIEIHNPTGKIDPELMQQIVEEVSYVINRDSER